MDLFTERCKKCWGVKKTRQPCDICTGRAVAKAKAFAPAVKLLGEDLICMVEGKPRQGPVCDLRSRPGLPPGETYGFSVADAMGMAGATPEQIRKGVSMVRGLKSEAPKYPHVPGGEALKYEPSIEVRFKATKLPDAQAQGRNDRGLAKSPDFSAAVDYERARGRLFRKGQIDPALVNQMYQGIGRANDERVIDEVLSGANHALGLPEPEMANFRAPAPKPPGLPAPELWPQDRRDRALAELKHARSAAALDDLHERWNCEHLPQRAPSQTSKVYRAILRRHLEGRTELPILHLIGSVPVEAIRMGLNPGHCEDCGSLVKSTSGDAVCPYCGVRQELFVIEGLLRHFQSSQTYLRVLSRECAVVVTRGKKEWVLPRDVYDTLTRACPMPAWSYPISEYQKDLAYIGRG